VVKYVAKRHLQKPSNRLNIFAMKAPDSQLETLALWLGIAYCVAVIVWMVKL
jgi:hypothetical protein